MSRKPSTLPPPSDRAPSPILRIATVAALVFLFLVGVHGLGDGFKSLGRDMLDHFFRATENPFIGLMVGILATTLVQSSSVTTSLVVGLVAAPDNALPLANAIPMIMGANIGTTVTNTLVSLGHMGRKAEFRRAFAVATIHDFFNFMSVAVLLPLEIMTGYLRRSATFLASLLTGVGGAHYESPIKGALKGALVPVKLLIDAIVSGEQARAMLLIVACALLIFGSLLLLVRVMRSAMRTRVEHFISSALGRRAWVGILLGIVATAMVQSSSITTSLLVPLAGAGLLTVPQAFPVTIGANLGTTVTALLAALAVTGPHALDGITIALVHLLFNVSGMLLIYPIPAIRRLPIAASHWFAEVAATSRRWAIIYVAVLFYGVPALFAYFFG